jgi:hypothetical protein
MHVCWQRTVESHRDAIGIAGGRPSSGDVDGGRK